jgi:hypothetical protein
MRKFPLKIVIPKGIEKDITRTKKEKDILGHKNQKFCITNLQPSS